MKMYLFVGGPADGERIEVRDGVRTVVIPIKEKQAVESAKFVSCEYVKRALFFGTIIKHDFFVANDDKNPDFVGKLIEGYGVVK